MGCILCGKEIGPIRLLRDNEFCTATHRKLFRERLNKALGQAGTVALRAIGLADFFTAISPVDCLAEIAHACADLIPVEWTSSHESTAPRFPLRIHSVAGSVPKQLPLQAADRQFQPVPDREFAVRRLPATLG